MSASVNFIRKAIRVRSHMIANNKSLKNSLQMERCIKELDTLLIIKRTAIGDAKVFLKYADTIEAILPGQTAATGEAILSEFQSLLAAANQTLSKERMLAI